MLAICCVLSTLKKRLLPLLPRPKRLKPIISLGIVIIINGILEEMPKVVLAPLPLPLLTILVMVQANRDIILGTVRQNPNNLPNKGVPKILTIKSNPINPLLKDKHPTQKLNLLITILIKHTSLTLIDPTIKT